MSFRTLISSFRAPLSPSPLYKTFSPNFSKLFLAGIVAGVATAFNTKKEPGSVHCTSMKERAVARIEPLQRPFNQTPANLEDHYADICFQDVNVDQEVDFAKFHAPNERYLLNLKPHLENTKDGVIVSTGTERSFFNLALSALGESGDKCTGLIVRDIDPQAIAYAHMITMMLRITKDAKDFERLSGPNRGPGIGQLTPIQIKQKIDDIQTRIAQSSDIPPKAKAFYLKHLNSFAPIYFKTQNRWRLSGGGAAATKYWQERENQGFLQELPAEYYMNSFQGVQYQKDETLFKTLQKFAKSGNIICTVGSINDLKFIKKDPLRLVDVSNIADYIPLELQCHEPCSPRVVWNNPEPPFIITRYRSYDHDSTRDKLSPDEKKEFDKLRSQLHQARVISGFLDRSVLKLPNTLETRPFGYYPEHLTTFKNYKEKWMIQHPTQGWISFGPSYARPRHHPSLPNTPPLADSLLTKSAQDLKEIAKLPETARFVPHLVSYWESLTREQYMAFSEVPGWKQAFLKEKEKQSKNSKFQEKFSNVFI